jgi:hypothetical protein
LSFFYYFGRCPIKGERGDRREDKGEEKLKRNRALAGFCLEKSSSKKGEKMVVLCGMRRGGEEEQRGCEKKKQKYKKIKQIKENIYPSR